MYPICVELIFYNDLESLKRCIPSIYEYIHCILAIDGRHTTYKKYNLLSDDGSREYLKSFDKIKLIDYPDYEVEKRNLAKQLCDTSTLLIIDSDEYVIGDWEEFYTDYLRIRKMDKKNINLYKVCMQRIDDSNMYTYHPLVFYKPQEFIYYNDCHNIPIKISESNLPNIYAPKSFNTPIKGITVMHDHGLRNEQRMKVREDNRKWQFENQK